MIKKCYCGKDFKTYKCHLKVGKGKYCSKKCSMLITNKKLEKSGEKTRFSKGQKTWNKIGFTYTRSRKNGKIYKLIYLPEHPHCDKKGYVREHRLIIEKELKRYLDIKEVVHHKDENTLNNNINNLELLTAKEHRILHLKDNVHKRWQKIPPDVRNNH